MKPGLRTGKPIRSVDRVQFESNQVLAGGCMRNFALYPCEDLGASGSATVDRTRPQFERSRPCLTKPLPLPYNLHVPVPIPRTMTDASLSCDAATYRNIVAIPRPGWVEESFTPATFVSSHSRDVQQQHATVTASHEQNELASASPSLSVPSRLVGRY